MKVNMGMLDRGFRLGFAIMAGLLYWTGTLDGAVGIVAIAIAGIFLLTSLVGFCPMYLPLKISTKKES
jgi:K+-transporting ATPase A subunit